MSGRETDSGPADGQQATAPGDAADGQSGSATEGGADGQPGTAVERAVAETRVPLVRPATVERLQTLGAAEVAVAVLCPVVLFAATGLGGAVVGLVGVSLWLFAPLSAAVVTQLGVVFLVPAWPGPGRAALLAAGIATLLLAEVVYEHTDRRTLAVFPALVVVLGGATLLALTAGVAPWLVAVGAVVGLAIASYGPHRYGLIQPDREVPDT